MSESTDTWTGARCGNCGTPIVSTGTGYTHVPRMQDPVTDCMNAIGPLPSIDPDRLSLVIGAFNIAFQGVPQDIDLLNRCRMALDACPEEIVRELGTAVGALVALIHERLGG